MTRLHKSTAEQKFSRPSLTTQEQASTGRGAAVVALALSPVLRRVVVSGFFAAAFIWTMKQSALYLWFLSWLLVVLVTCANTINRRLEDGHLVLSSQDFYDTMKNKQTDIQAVRLLNLLWLDRSGWCIWIGMSNCGITMAGCFRITIRTL